MTDSPESRTVASVVSFASLLQKGVERIADFQKIALDLYAHQTADLVDSCNRFSWTGLSYPGNCLMDIAGQGLRHFVEMQKNLLNLIVEQSVKGIEVIRPMEAVIPHAAVMSDQPSDESMDRLIAEQEEQAAIATKVVDKIEAMVSQAPPVVIPDAALQQKPEEKAKMMMAHGTARRPHPKRSNINPK